MTDLPHGLRRVERSPDSDQLDDFYDDDDLADDVPRQSGRGLLGEMTDEVRTLREAVQQQANCGVNQPTTDNEPLGTPVPLVSAQQLADMLSVPKTTIYALRRAEKIPFHRIGKHYRFDLEEVKGHFHNGATQKGKSKAAAGSVLLEGEKRSAVLAHEEPGSGQTQVHPAGTDHAGRSCRGLPRSRKQSRPSRICVKLPDIDGVD